MPKGSCLSCKDTVETTVMADARNLLKRESADLLGLGTYATRESTKGASLAQQFSIAQLLLSLIA
jgi:hypothetical protein